MSRKKCRTIHSAILFKAIWANKLYMIFCIALIHISRLHPARRAVEGEGNTVGHTVLVNIARSDKFHPEV